MKSRLQKDERYEQLLALSLQIITEEGTEALTLISLADKAGVTKPITYRHFGNRKTLLYTLFQDTLTKLSLSMTNGINEHANSLDDAIHIFVKTYMSCFAKHGQACFSIISALKAYPEYSNIDSELQDFFCNILQSSLAPFLPKNQQVEQTTLMMIFGATCCLGGLLANQNITQDEFLNNITYLIKQLITTHALKNPLI